MKAPRLHLTTSRRPRRTPLASSPATPRAWKAPPLIWRRLLMYPTPIAVTRNEQHLHQQFFAALHFQLLHTDGQGGARVGTAVRTHKAGAITGATQSPRAGPRLVKLRSAQTVWAHRNVHWPRPPAVDREETPRSLNVAASVARGSVSALSQPAFSPNEAHARQAARRLPHLVHAATPNGPARLVVATAARSERDTQPEAADNAVRALALRSPPLVWAKPEPTEGPSQTHSEAPATSVNAHSTPPTSRAAGAAHAALPPAQFQQLARDTQRSLLLDASFTDRLADGVLARVDKRLRIERERRGL